MDELIGNWEGAIQVPGQALPIAVKFDGENGAISIPVQGIKDFPLTALNFTDPAIHFEMAIQNQQLVFDGALEQDTIAGTFTQQRQSFPFELSRAAAAEEEIGTHTEIEVEGGSMTALVLTPEGEGPFPAMLLLSGSGPTDKNGNSQIIVGKNNSLKMLAEELKAKGIAVIRYDKRGVGDNAALAKNESELRFYDYAEDAAAWIRFAKEDERFSDIAVIGHSEGALVGLVIHAVSQLVT